MRSEVYPDVPRCGSTEEEILTPSLTKRTCEQVTLLLVGYAWVGDTGARDLLELFFQNLVQNNFCEIFS